MYRVSFTGYRPEKLPFFSEDDPMCVELKNRLSKQIEQLIKDGADEFFSGMARGVDIWAAEAVLELRRTYPDIKLTAVIPCPEQANSWSEEDRDRYHAILEACDKKLVISPHYSKGCMHKRNKALVDTCDILVAVFDGQSGGTKQTVAYAKSKGRKTLLITPM